MKEGIIAECSEGKCLAAHQTYFFPYLGYFSVIDSSDYYVHLDSFQYEKQGWMNRNRIIGECGRVKNIIVPTKHTCQKAPVNEVEIDYCQNWQQYILNQLGYYKKRAPFYKETVEILNKLFSENYPSIAALSMKSIDLVMEYLGLPFSPRLVSELKIMPNEKPEPDEWGIWISKCFSDVTTYRNAPGGKQFYEVEKYEKANLNIEFIQNRLKPYDQKNDEFIPSLSIIDVLMFNTPEQVKELIKDYYVL